MRNSEYAIDAEFMARWSPRAYNPAFFLNEADLLPLFEAARWAPSSSNEQPWKFYYPKSKLARPDFNAFVNDNNRTWAQFAASLIVVCARKNFAVSGLPNPHAWYDTGAAVLSLILQAQKVGLSARQMAGILRQPITEKLAIDAAAEDIICVVAIGQAGDAAQLTEKHRTMENPNGRKAISEFALGI